MATSSVIARRYFDALTKHELDAAVAWWAPGAVERLVGQDELIAPDGIREYFGALFDAFPDFAFEVVDTTTQRERCTVRWRATATFIGPGRFQGFAPNGERIAIEGCDVVEVADDLIVANTAYLDSGDIARQLGFLPPAGSRAESRLTALANARTLARKTVYGAEPEAIAAGVWVLRGGLPRTMNVYLIEDEGGVTVFDAGIAQMTGAIRAAGARFGGIRRVVLGHADADHRGGAAGLDAPIYCHPLERSAARSPSPYRDYWNLGLLRAWSRPVLTRLLARLGRRRAGARRQRRGGRGDRRLQRPAPAGSRARTDRSLPGGGRPCARLGLLLHAQPGDRHRQRRSRSASGLQPRHQPGARIDPPAGGARPEGSLAGARQAGVRRGRRAATAACCLGCRLA